MKPFTIEDVGPWEDYGRGARRRHGRRTLASVTSCDWTVYDFSGDTYAWGRETGLSGRDHADAALAAMFVAAYPAATLARLAALEAENATLRAENESLAAHIEGLKIRLNEMADELADATAAR